MGVVYVYLLQLFSCKASLPYDLVKIKVKRIMEELYKLTKAATYVMYSCCSHANY